MLEKLELPPPPGDARHGKGGHEEGRGAKAAGKNQVGGRHPHRGGQDGPPPAQVDGQKAGQQHGDQVARRLAGQQYAGQIVAESELFPEEGDERAQGLGGRAADKEGEEHVAQQAVLLLRGDFVVHTEIMLLIVMILIATSAVFGDCLTKLHVPDLAAKAIVGLTDNRIILILLLNVILLVLGMIMDMAPIILIATPILLPVATQYCGLDPIQFGIMVVLNCGIGLLTPPVGAVLFIGSAVAKRPMEKVVKATLPFYACMIIALLLISFIPDISLAIPKLCGYDPAVPLLFLK